MHGLPAWATKLQCAKYTIKQKKLQACLVGLELSLGHVASAGVITQVCFHNWQHFNVYAILHLKLLECWYLKLVVVVNH